MNSNDANFWEVGTKHPYYCSAHDSQHFSNWESFLEDWGNADKDYNCLFRWDFEWYGEEYNPNEPDTTDPYVCLSLVYVLQRKGRLMQVQVDVKKSEEPAVRDFLESHWQQMLTLWKPFGEIAPAS